jgi:Cu/Ag efflux protein CusF
MTEHTSVSLGRFVSGVLPFTRAAVFGAAVFAFACAAHAAAPAAKAASAPQGVGQAALVRVQARVVAIDTDSNSLLLEGPRGNQLAVDVDPAVGDVDRLEVGDTLDIVYRNALLVRADKAPSNGIRERIDTDTTTAVSEGETTSIRSVEIVATVEKIDRKKRLVTLRGPSLTEVFQVPDDIPLDNLKVGNNVHIAYRAATAVEITKKGGARVK